MTGHERTIAALLAVAFALPRATAAAADADTSAATPWFRDVSAEAGLKFAHVRALAVRLWLPEIMSGGAAWLDADGDGRLDLYLVQGGRLGALAGQEPEQDTSATPLPANVLLRNTGQGFEDVTDASGPGTRATAWARPPPISMATAIPIST